MPRSLVGSCFRVGLDQNARAGVFLLRKDQHLAKAGAVGLGGGHGGIAAQLVHHQYIAGIRHRRAGGKGVVFAEVGIFYTANGVAGPAHHLAVVQRVRRQNLFQIRGLRGIKMHPLAIQQ